MRTDKQNQASKINGAKSNGPVTEEGKAKSSRNSHRHNLTGANLVLLSNEDPVDFRAHAKSYLDRFAPIDLVEHNLVKQLIAASWRLARISSWECSLFGMLPLRNPDGSPARRTREGILLPRRPRAPDPRASRSC